jgi:alanyl-tRNA synthetase
LRRILRRAARYSRILGQDEPVLYRFVQLVVDTMADVFPELQQRRQHIETTIRAEEEQFNRTLDKGLQLFSQAAAELAKDGEKGIPGELVFKLYDTYGFPDDLTRVLAEEKGLDVDMEGYERAMQVQKDRARAAANFATRESDNLTWQVLQTGPGSDFTGYHHHREETRIQSYATSNGHVFLTLEKTPFYAESGGQVADTGRIEAASFALYVIDVQKDNERIIHRCEWQTGSQIVDEPVVAVIDESKRQLTAKNHTATHLMHAALRQVLGEHVQQAGSLVDAERLRFDFNHNQRVEAEEIRRIERLVNLEIRRNTALRIEDTSLREAREAGAMALFGEKYGDRVRTVAVPGFSLELCGGTHVASTGEIGIFKIVSETSIAAGVRRIEAITGPAVEDTMYQQQGVLFELQALLNSKADDIVSKVQALKQEKKQLEKQVSELKQTHFNSLAGTLLQQAKTVGKTPFVLHRDDSLDMEALRKLGENVYEQMNGSGVALIYAVNGGKMLLCCVVAAELVQNKMANAGNLVGAAAKIAGGGGGGKAHLATAGGRDVNQLEAVLAFFTEQVAAI